MKWSKKWVAAMMLLPATYLVSCGSGNRDNSTGDTLTTQSPPPSGNSSTSDSRNTGDSSLSSSPRVDNNPGMQSGSTDPNGVDRTSSAANGTSTESAKTGSTGATGNTGTASGNTGLSKSERTGVSSANGVTRRSGTTARKSRMHRKSSTHHTSTANSYSSGHNYSSGSTATSKHSTDSDSSVNSTQSNTENNNRSVRSSVDTAASRVKEMTGTVANKMGEMGDSAARKVGRFADTVASKTGELSDTAASRMNRMSDTVSSRFREMGDSSTMNRKTWDTASSIGFDSIRGRKGNISEMTEKQRTGNYSDSTSPETNDSSRTMSTMGSGMNFTPSIFIPEQIRGNYAEIKMARMAIEKSGSEEVKRIARTLENDHNALLRELQTLGRNAISGSDSLPTSENDMAKRHMEMMNGLSSQEFDRQWLQQMHMMHEQKVQMLEQAEANNTIEDAQVKAWVNKTLPTLRKHRDMLAQALNSQNR